MTAFSAVKPGQRATCAVLVLASLAAPAAAGARREGGAAAPAARDVADMDITELVNVPVSPFDVSSHLDRGYRAPNAVSASRVDAPVRQLPFAIQAFTGSFIDDLNPRDVHDVARFSPAVTYRSNDFNEGNANLAVRGFAVSTVPGGTQLLRDGVAGPSVGDFTNVARLEVVKGPSSFLYGQVAPGGIVNLITKSPQLSFSATGEATVGTRGEHRTQVDVTGPVSPTLSYRLAASRDQDIHYWEPYDAHSSNVSPSLLWRPTDRVSVSLKYERFHKLESPQLMQKPGYGQQRGVLPSAGDPNLQGVDVPGLPDTWNSMSEVDYRRSSSGGLNTWVDLEVGEHWHLRTGYARQRYEVDALFSGNFGMASNDTFLQGRRLRGQTYTNRDETLSIDAVGNFRVGPASLRLLLGSQLARRRFDNWAAQAPNDAALGSDPIASPLPLWDLRDPSTWNRQVSIPRSALTESVNNARSDATDKSLYAGSTLGLLGDRLLLLAGWRLTTTHRTIDDLVSARTARLDSRKATPQFGALYTLVPGLSAFASYAESFVPGARILTRLDGSTAPAAPSEGRGFDLGLKADLMDGRVSGTLSLFDLRNRRIVHDVARTSAAGSVEFYHLQSGEQRSRGLELDLTLAPSRQWQVYLSYSHMDARIVEVTGRDDAILAQDPGTLDAAGRLNYKTVALLHGARLQMSAPNLFNVWTRYDIARGPLQGVYLAGGAHLVRDQTLLPDGPPSSRQSYTLVHALAGVSWRADGQRLSLELAGRNLGHVTYRPSQSSRSRPREFTLTLRAML